MKTTIIPLTQLTKSLKKKEDHIKMFEQTDKSFTKFQIANTSEQFYYSNYDNAIYDINKVLKSHTSPKDQTWFEVIKETRNIKGKSSSPYWIRILLGHACNYSCSYCLQKDIGNPDERQKIETTDKFILDLEKLNWSSVEKVDLWGGEPFLYWNTMVPLMRHFDRQNLTWFISTNGSALQQKHVDFFASLKSTVEIGLSHDALAHERLRGPEVLIKKVEILKMMQSAPNIKFGINTVISDSNFDLFEINDFFYNYLTENNLDKSKFGLGFILGRNHDYENTHNSAMHVISDENLPKFKKILKTYIEKGIEQTLKKVDNKILNNSLLFGPTGVFDFAKSMRSQVLPTITTSCGVDDARVLSVDMQSNVRTCPHVDDSFISGHLTDLENVVLKNVDFNRYETHCNSCEVFRLCKSNCPIEVPDEVFYSNCKNEKVWYREIQFAAFNIMFNSEVIKIES